jgi:S1-C subfamily serine protease
VAAKGEAPNSPKSGRTGTQIGTGYVISASGHIITNHHVVDGCVGDLKGNLTGDAAVTLRVVNSDAATTSRCCRARQTPSSPSRKSATARSIPAIPWLQSASPITACCHPISR